MNALLELFPLIKESYAKATLPVCQKYGMTAAECDVLLFLANHPAYDRATDIVEKRHIVKSQVSTSITALEQKGYLRRTHRENDRRTIHLELLPAAANAIADGKAAQLRFFDAVLADFSDAQRQIMLQNMQHLMNNMKAFLQEEH